MCLEAVETYLVKWNENPEAEEKLNWRHGEERYVVQDPNQVIYNCIASAIVNDVGTTVLTT